MAEGNCVMIDKADINALLERLARSAVKIPGSSDWSACARQADRIRAAYGVLFDLDLIDADALLEYYDEVTKRQNEYMANELERRSMEMLVSR